MVDFKQKGEPTYRRDMVYWVWNPKQLENELFRLVNKFGKQYAGHLAVSGIDIKPYKWTQLGPHSEIAIKIDKDYRFVVACYRDGWHIKLENIQGSINFHMRQEVFGDKNRNRMWTQETEKVPHMMGQLYKEMKRYFKENE